MEMRKLLSVPHDQSSKIVGYCDSVNRTLIEGWAYDLIRPNVPLTIELVIDGKSVRTVTCNRLRRDVAQAGHPSHVGFSIIAPLELQNTDEHIVEFIDSDGMPIAFKDAFGTHTSWLLPASEAYQRYLLINDNNSYQVEETQDSILEQENLVFLEGESQDFVGSSDPFTGVEITGWALSRHSPNNYVRLRISVDGNFAGTARHDVSAERKGEFKYVIPECYYDGITHSLSIQFDDGTPLLLKDADGCLQQQISFTAEPLTSIEGVIDGLVSDSIKGWVVRKNHRDGTIEGMLHLDVFCNDIRISGVVADLPRMDVAREKKCDPRVGFSFRLPAHCCNGLEFEFVFRVLPENEEIGSGALLVKYRPHESVDDLRLLADAVGDLCATAFKLQQKMRELLPIASGTVLDYDRWARRYLARLRARIASAEPLPTGLPLVSIVMPTYKTSIPHLTAAIESVRAQTYQRWELIIVDDGSCEPSLLDCVTAYAKSDDRIVRKFRQENGGISEATNDAIRLAIGRYLVFFDHDDLMVEVAIEALVREALKTNAKFIYSDEDKIDTFGVLSEPNLKPDWNYRLLLGINYICHLVMVDRALVKSVGNLRTEYNGAQDHDFLLRLSEHCPAEQIVHLPEILYHWRKTASSTAESGEAKPYAIEAGRRAIADHLLRRGFENSQVEAIGQYTSYKVKWGLSQQPSVTIIIPFKDQITITQRCLNALLNNTHWVNWQVVLVDNGSITPEAADFSQKAVLNPNVFILRIDEPFNYSRLNNLAARDYPAECYVFLNNDVFLEQPDWLSILINEALADSQVAIVGAKLIYPNNTVQHAGVVLGVGGVADHVFRGIPTDHPGYLSRAICAQQYSAVTAACMLCRADVFMAVGGFDEQELTVAFNDIDLCLKVGKEGWKVIWTPDLIAEHHESLSRGEDIAPEKIKRFFYENQIMLQRWHDIIAADPYYNPHFSRDRGIYTDLK